jgi:hypothetical protein
MINCMKINSNGQQTAVRRGTPQVKFVDNPQSVAVSNIGTILAPGITNVTQGVGVSQRTGDTLFYKELFLNYNAVAINADIFSSLRVIVFQWKPNTSLVIPTVTDILQTANIFSMYDWQFSSQYIIIYDKIHNFAGVAAAPSSSGNQSYFGKIDLSRAGKRVEFSPGAVSASNELFILVISDSVAVPFPQFTCISRITYSEE